MNITWTRLTSGQWNTYGDPPNSDLLRKYGHVDMVPLPQGGEGNPSDIVEVRADLLVSALTQQNHEISSESTKERIDWWLEEGGDEWVTHVSLLVLSNILTVIQCFRVRD